MSVPTIFDLCTPRTDVLAGTSSDSDFAADLSHVIRGTGGPVEYSDPVRFFANTFPTRGLKGLPLPASRKMQFYHYVSLAICAP